jgi:hypothetical protein
MLREMQVTRANAYHSHDVDSHHVRFGFLSVDYGALSVFALRVPRPLFAPSRQARIYQTQRSLSM